MTTKIAIFAHRKTTMLDKLEAIKLRWEDVEEQLSNPDVIQDMKRFAALNKEYKDLTKIVEEYKVYKNVMSNIEANKDILNNEKDPEQKDWAAAIKVLFPNTADRGTHVNVSGVALTKAAPNKDNAIKFMNFLLDPENAAAVTNYAAYTSGVAGVEPFLFEAIKTSPENNPPAGITPGVFAQACDAETQKFYDAIWTNLKK